MGHSAEDRLPRSTGIPVQTSAADVCDEDLLSAGDGAQSKNSELSCVRVDREPRIWGARVVEP